MPVGRGRRSVTQMRYHGIVFNEAEAPSAPILPATMTAHNHTSSTVFGGDDGVSSSSSTQRQRQRQQQQHQVQQEDEDELQEIMQILEQVPKRRLQQKLLQQLQQEQEQQQQEEQYQRRHKKNVSLDSNHPHFHRSLLADSESETSTTIAETVTSDFSSSRSRNGGVGSGHPYYHRGHHHHHRRSNSSGSDSNRGQPGTYSRIRRPPPMSAMQRSYGSRSISSGSRDCRSPLPYRSESCTSESVAYYAYGIEPSPSVSEANAFESAVHVDRNNNSHNNKQHHDTGSTCSDRTGRSSLGPIDVDEMKPVSDLTSYSVSNVSVSTRATVGCRPAYTSARPATVRTTKRTGMRSHSCDRTTSTISTMQMGSSATLMNEVVDTSDFSSYENGNRESSCRSPLQDRSHKQHIADVDSYLDEEASTYSNLMDSFYNLFEKDPKWEEEEPEEEQKHFYIDYDIDETEFDRQLCGYEVGFEVPIVTDMAYTGLFEARRKFSEELIPEKIIEDDNAGGGSPHQHQQATHQRSRDKNLLPPTSKKTAGTSTKATASSSKASASTQLHQLPQQQPAKTHKKTFYNYKSRKVTHY